MSGLFAKLGGFIAFWYAVLSAVAHLATREHFRKKMLSTIFMTEASYGNQSQDLSPASTSTSRKKAQIPRLDLSKIKTPKDYLNVPKLK